MTGSPYDERACPGPCNRRYRTAVDQHQNAVDVYEHAAQAYEQAHMWWQARTAEGVLVVREPAAPEPPANPKEPMTAGQPVWCPRCATSIRAALPGLDDLACCLEAWADGHRGAASGEKLGKTPAKASANSPSSIADTLDVLYGLLVTVEDDWREYRGYLTRPRRPRTSEARALTIAWLSSRLGEILDNPGSVRFGSGVLAWERRLQALTRSEPIVRRRPAVRCPGCGQRAMRTRDDGYTICGACGRLVSEDEYQALAVEQDGQHAEVRAP